MAGGLGALSRLSRMSRSSKGKSKGQQISLMPVEYVLYLLLVTVVLFLVYFGWQWMKSNCRKASRLQLQPAHDDELRRRRLEKLAGTESRPAVNGRETTGIYKKD
eukprot:TRINITY_DN76126_c0_g1_i1.p1 TRINITY_DN76126_c0_g1~~TRINITY_DN76126_c0_g1_i1.p1  ORF type:complete len:105 (+),score=14.45 TRINITY_DN76126_c0_g1_i1:91-405(+)